VKHIGEQKRPIYSSETLHVAQHPGNVVAGETRHGINHAISSGLIIAGHFLIERFQPRED
jgi:hypothetical protein